VQVSKIKKLESINFVNANKSLKGQQRGMKNIPAGQTSSVAIKDQHCFLGRLCGQSFASILAILSSILASIASAFTRALRAFSTFFEAAPRNLIATARGWTVLGFSRNYFIGSFLGWARHGCLQS
jgi:hypothetical protein